jgi:hypothetical protein
MVGQDPIDGFLASGIWVATGERMGNSEPLACTDDAEDDFLDAETTDFLDLEHDIRQQVFDSLNMVDGMFEESMRNSQNPPAYEEEVSATEELEQLYRQASRPLWRTEDCVSSVSFISTVVVIMTMCTTHGVSNAFTDELLKYLSTSLLPKENCLPTSFYYAKNAVRKMGLQYNVIHCCPAGHVLFRGELEDRDTCPKPECGLSRWIPGSTTVPAKVLRHFPLIPRLKCMFRSPTISKLLKWASKNKTGTDEMKSVANSPAWNHVDTDIDT